MDKSPDAFRTISEVAEALETPAHVLRFWESRFPQIRPVKRAGGRRYYRPADVALLNGIRHLLHDEGMTIRGVQKILREQGVRHVASITAEGAAAAFDMDAEEEGADLLPATEPAEPDTAEIVSIDMAARRPSLPNEGRAEILPLRPKEPEAEVAVEGILFTSLPPLPDTLPPLTEEVAEAGYVWVEDEPELGLTPPAPLHFSSASSGAAEEEDALLPLEKAIHAAQEAALMAEGNHGQADLVRLDDSAAKPLFANEDPPTALQDMPVPLSGLAARIRALTGPLQNYDQLAELHSRLGLLHAQMAEAQRLGR